MMDKLTHFNREGRARMVDVTAKEDTERVAVATGSVFMAADTLQRIQSGTVGKGDVLAVAQVAGIMAAKKTWELIPMCHPLLLTGVELQFGLEPAKNAVHIQATVKTTGKTGVEMEALSAVTVAALTIYDMCKAMDRGMTIGKVGLLHKDGGRSGSFVREGEL